MQLSDLFQLIRNCCDTDQEGGGQFLLQLSDMTIKREFQGPGKNKLYPPDPSTRTKKQQKNDRDLRQKWFTGAKRQIPQACAQFWLRNFDQERCLDFLDRHLSTQPVGNYRAILEHNGYRVTRGSESEVLCDLLFTGLTNQSSGKPINDRDWDPQLISATAGELAQPIAARPRISELGPDQIKVVGRTLHLGDYTIPLVEQSVPEQLEREEAEYTRQLIQVLCTKRELKPILSELRNAGGDELDDFDFARECYYLAESLRMTLIRASLDGEAEFTRIKDDMYAALRPTHRRQYASDFDRMQATLEQANMAQLSQSHITNTQGLFSNQQRQGTTHMLVNDKKLRWVDDA